MYLCLFFAILCFTSQTGSLSHVLDDSAPRSCQRVVRNSFDYSAGDVPFLRNTGSAFGAYGAGRRYAAGVLPFRGTATSGLAPLKPHVAQKRIIISHLGLFQRRLPQFLLRCRQCYSAELNACSNVNARTLFQGSDFVGKAAGVQPAEGRRRPGAGGTGGELGAVLAVVRCLTASAGAAPVLLSEGIGCGSAGQTEQTPSFEQIVCE